MASKQDGGECPGCSRHESGMGIVGLLILLIVVGMVVWTCVQLRRAPEAKYAATRSEFATPESLFQTFLAEKAKFHGKLEDPIDGLLSCMTVDDAIWFREIKRAVSMDSQYGIASAIGSEKEQERLALQVLLRATPSNPATQVTRVYSQGDKAIVYYPAGTTELACALMVREGKNWKIKDWFGQRWGEDAEGWLYTKEGMGGDLTDEEQDWLKGPGQKKKEEALAAFHSSVGAPPPEKKPEGLSPDEQSKDSESATEFLASYVECVAALLGGAGTADEALRFHTSDDRQWFERYWRDIAAIAPGGAGLPPSRESAMKAILPYGPTTSQASITDIKTAGSRALATMNEARTEGAKEFKVCLIKEGDEWRIATFFFSRQLHWMPAILQGKAARKESLASDEMDFQQNGKARFEQTMKDFYTSVGEPVPDGRS